MGKASQTKGRGRKRREKCVIVGSSSYGAALKGTRIYYEGRRPRGLKDDGRIQFGKHVLQALKAKYPRFRWIITEDRSDITTQRGVVRVRISQVVLPSLSRRLQLNAVLCAR